MDSIIDFEKVKNPTIAFIGGILLGGYVVWHSVSNLNEQLLKTLEATKMELKHQVTIQAKTITEKEAELNILNAKLTAKAANLTTSNYKPGTDLKNYIAQIDNKIVTKNMTLQDIQDSEL